jgi:hypothetical protein
MPSTPTPPQRTTTRRSTVRPPRPPAPEQAPQELTDLDQQHDVYGRYVGDAPSATTPRTKTGPEIRKDPRFRDANGRFKATDNRHGKGWRD